ncbi:hypothetical protein PCASD_13386 [Puccinia coronata f. sp. avenae]|uniref:Uncharacterized protein n=1 Tax=Puccinia coronata f. sp. avenae TaxID=200324 RepID=A0A2N5TZE6_9BASI|nr:hypothetical protein PCASD_13386 [Puccinia coronata f. sp. avenae]
MKLTISPKPFHSFLFCFVIYIAHSVIPSPPGTTPRSIHKRMEYVVAGVEDTTLLSRVTEESRFTIPNVPDGANNLKNSQRFRMSSEPDQAIPTVISLERSRSPPTGGAFEDLLLLESQFCYILARSRSVDDDVMSTEIFR